MNRIVLSTRNQGKIAELNAMLKDFGVEALGLDHFPEIPEIEENGLTFQENALLKAETVNQATGLIAVADDSGLEVDALDGAPGVFSARYSGLQATDEQNNTKLLNELKNIPPDKRSARFRCVIAAVGPKREPIIAQGTWEGVIATTPAGKNGFGYDPLFFDPDLGQTAAQMDKSTKNSRSHRGKALRNLLLAWPEEWRGDRA